MVKEIAGAERKWRGAISTVILMLIALTPILNISEVYSIMTGDLLGLAHASTPLAIKSIKDIGFLIIAVFSLIAVIISGKTKRFVLILGPALLLVAALFVLSYRGDKVQALAGLRWALPILLPIFLIDNIDDDFIPKMAKAAAIICIINTVFQIYGHFITNEVVRAYESCRIPLPLKKIGLRISIFGLRMPGIFSMPNTSAFFACAAAFLSYFYLRSSTLRDAVLILTPVSILLSGSATAIIVYAVSASIIAVKKKPFRDIGFFVILLILTGFIVLHLPRLTGRRDIFQSSLCRVEILKESLTSPELISTQFGRRTNSFQALADKPQKGNIYLAPESMPVALITNIGLLGSIAFVGAYIYWAAVVICSRRLDAAIFTLIYTLFSLSLPISETFPMNLLFAVGIVSLAPKIFTRLKILHG